MYRRDRRDTDDYVECQHENLIPCYNYLYCDSISRRICYKWDKNARNLECFSDNWCKAKDTKKWYNCNEDKRCQKKYSSTFATEYWIVMEIRDSLPRVSDQNNNINNAVSPASTNGQVYQDSPQNGGQNTGIGRYWRNNGDSGLSASQNVKNTMTNAAQGLVNGDYRQSFVYNQNGDQNQQTVDHKNLNINIPTTTQRQHFNKPNINRDQNSPTTKSTKVLNR